MSRNLEVNILEDLFSTIELHVLRLASLKEIETNHNIGQKNESDLKTLMDRNHKVYLSKKKKKY